MSIFPVASKVSFSRVRGAFTKRRAVERVLKNLELPPMGSEYVQNLRASLMSEACPVESLHWFAGMLAAGGAPASDLREQLASKHLLDGPVHDWYVRGIEVHVRNNLLFLPLLGEEYQVVDALVRGLRYSDRFLVASSGVVRCAAPRVKDFSLCGDEELGGYVAVMRAALELRGRYPETGAHPVTEYSLPRHTASRQVAYILGEPLFSFVFDNPDEVERIVGLVVSRRMTDPVALRELMGVASSVTAPLVAGAL